MSLLAQPAAHLIDSTTRPTQVKVARSARRGTIVDGAVGFARIG
jgi:hypothetical protein